MYIDRKYVKYYWAWHSFGFKARGVQTWLCSVHKVDLEQEICQVVILVCNDTNKYTMDPQIVYRHIPLLLLLQRSCWIL